MKVIEYWYRHFGFFPYVFVWILKNWIDDSNMDFTTTWFNSNIMDNFCYLYCWF